MTVSQISFRDWRNIEEASVSLGPGINVLWGMNAQGKSNILEGIYYFARGKSFRAAADRELIRFGCDFARAELSFRKDGYENDTVLEITLPRSGKKQLTRGGARLSSVSELLGNFRAVLFCPAHLSLITGGPLERRTFLDIAISQLSGTYLAMLRRYSRALSERNSLLKAAAGQAPGSVTVTEWEVYATQLAEYGSWIAAYRSEYSAMLEAAVARYFEGMTGGAEIPALTYVSHAMYEGIPKPLSDADAAPTGDILYEKLTTNIDREIAAGSTLWGIHKDDLRLSLNGRDARLYASQGQQRSIALSMKLAEAEISKNQSGEYPAILLDDVFSELDESRRRYILDSIVGRQIIVTSCEPDIIPRGQSDTICFRRIEGGSVM